MLLPSKDRLLNGLSEAKGFSLLSLALSCERKVTAYLFYCSSLFPLFSSEQINLSALPAFGENTANVWESIFYFLANFLKACGAVWWIDCLFILKSPGDDMVGYRKRIKLLCPIKNEYFKCCLLLRSTSPKSAWGSGDLFIRFIASHSRGLWTLTFNCHNFLFTMQLIFPTPT